MGRSFFVQKKGTVQRTAPALIYGGICVRYNP